MGNLMNRIHDIFWTKIEFRILIQGLDSAGKTTLLYRMKLGEVVTTIPTIGFNVETIKVKSLHLTAWDVGGRDKLRALYRHYYQNTSAVVYVIDSDDRERVEQAVDEFQTLLQEDELKNAVLLLLANKQDLPGCMSVAEIAEHFKLHETKRICNVMACSATDGSGMTEALEWLTEALADKQAGDGLGAEKHVQGSDKKKHLNSFWNFTEHLKSLLRPG